MMLGPIAYLAAAPTDPVQVPTLTQPDGARQVLEQPPSSRQSGWNMMTLDRARLINGTRLRVSNGDRKHIDLLADGTLLAVAAFEGFLSWGSDDVTVDPRVHGLAVVEFTYEFVNLYTQLLREYVDPRPRAVRFCIGIESAVFSDDDGRSHALYLDGGPIGGFSLMPQERAAHSAPEKTLRRELTIPTSDDDNVLEPGVVAYELVRQVYNWFSHLDDEVPYTVGEPRSIDIEAIKALG